MDAKWRFTDSPDAGMSWCTRRILSPRDGSGGKLTFSKTRTKRLRAMSARSRISGGRPNLSPDWAILIRAVRRWFFSGSAKSSEANGYAALLLFRHRHATSDLGPRGIRIERIDSFGELPGL